MVLIIYYVLNVSKSFIHIATSFPEHTKQCHCTPLVGLCFQVPVPGEYVFGCGPKLKRSPEMISQMTDFTATAGPQMELTLLGRVCGAQDISCVASQAT